LAGYKLIAACSLMLLCSGCEQKDTTAAVVECVERNKEQASLGTDVRAACSAQLERPILDLDIITGTGNFDCRYSTEGSTRSFTSSLSNRSDNLVVTRVSIAVISSAFPAVRREGESSFVAALAELNGVTLPPVATWITLNQPRNVTFLLPQETACAVLEEKNSDGAYRWTWHIRSLSGVRVAVR